MSGEQWTDPQLIADGTTKSLIRVFSHLSYPRLRCRIWLEEEEVWPGAIKPPLEWLHLPEIMAANSGRLERLRQELLRAGMFFGKRPTPQYNPLCHERKHHLGELCAGPPITTFSLTVTPR